MVDATLVATLTAVPTADDLGELGSRADVLEVRADLLEEVSPAFLRTHFPGRLLFTLRSSAEGGSFGGTEEERTARLTAASSHYDLVDLEAARDLGPDVLNAVPAERRLLSWHGSTDDWTTPEEIFERMSGHRASYYKLVPTARSMVEAARPLLLLERLGRTDVVAFASGPIGVWTRIIAPRLGAALVFGSAGQVPAAPGQPTLDTLIDDYGLPGLRPAERLFGVVGTPVHHSLSPRLHNRLYRSLGVEAVYLPFDVRQFGSFWLNFVERDIPRQLDLALEGLSVTSPHKKIALAVAGASSPLAGRIGAANTLVRRRGVWEAEASDPDGVVLPLLERGVTVRGARAGVLGAGGAGVSAAVGLQQAGAEVCLFNRTLESAESAAGRIGVKHGPAEELDPSAFDILVNATPLGRDDTDDLPFDLDKVPPATIVVDMAYRHSTPTRLARGAADRGLELLEGREVLLYQAGRQFRMMTGLEFPLDEARAVLFGDGELG